MLKLLPENETEHLILKIYFTLENDLLTSIDLEDTFFIMIGKYDAYFLDLAIN